MLTILLTMLAATASLIFSTVTYSLRQVSRGMLQEKLEARGAADRLEAIWNRRHDLTLLTASLRLLANISILLGALHWYRSDAPLWIQYLLAVLTASFVALMVSIIVPSAVSRWAADSVVAAASRPLLLVLRLLGPLTLVIHAVDAVARKLAGRSHDEHSEVIEQQIVSVVEEGVKEGVVDEEEREMIESVIEFRDRQAGQIMTARTRVVAIELGASLREVKSVLEESGHSRVPVYEGTLDHIVGILYARDLLKHLGMPPEKFDMRSAMRPALFVPETKPLRDLLREFRLQKVHLAIVLDEYGGTAGLITIEDILEELVGDISDEHEPKEPPQLTRLGESAFEADAALSIHDVNEICGLRIPEDADYETLGGFIATTRGQIPAIGAHFEHQNARYTVLDAEPQRVKRVRIEVLAPTEAARG